jgi:undecaprenyl-diphosphatase
VSFFESVILSLLQGLTEFLPVSSSGHLAILEHVWRLAEDVKLPLTTMLHLGTAAAMVVYFGRRLVGLVGGCFVREPERNRTSWRMLGFILLGSVPAAAVGLLLEDLIARAFSSPALVAAMLLVTGAALFGTRFVTVAGKPLGWGRALLVGVAQAIAILPGISRSGATITTGICLGMDRQEAFEFSFLLGMPAIAGAAFLELRKLDLAHLSVIVVAAGMLVAFVSGLAALALLKRAVTGRRLHWFAFYCWLAGIAALAFVR